MFFKVQVFLLHIRTTTCFSSFSLSFTAALVIRNRVKTAWSTLWHAASSQKLTCIQADGTTRFAVTTSRLSPLCLDWIWVNRSIASGPTLQAAATFSSEGITAFCARSSTGEKKNKTNTLNHTLLNFSSFDIHQPVFKALSWRKCIPILDIVLRVSA